MDKGRAQRRGASWVEEGATNNPKHYSRATFTNSGVKFIALPVASPCLSLFLSLDAAAAAAVAVWLWLCLCACAAPPGGYQGYRLAFSFRLPQWSSTLAVFLLQFVFFFFCCWPGRPYIRPSSNFLFYEWRKLLLALFKLLLLLFLFRLRPQRERKENFENACQARRLSGTQTA